MQPRHNGVWFLVDNVSFRGRKAPHGIPRQEALDLVLTPFAFANVAPQDDI